LAYRNRMAEFKVIALVFALSNAGLVACGGSSTPAASTTTAPSESASVASAPPPPPSASSSASAGNDFAVDLPLETKTDGQPDIVTEKNPKIAVWHEKKKFFLAVTTAGQKRHFKGKITVSGDATFTKLDQWVDEKEAAADAKWLTPSMKLSDDGKEISFDLVSESKGISGVSFNVKGEGQVTWELAIGGAKEKDAVRYVPADVDIGADGHHPSSVPFKTWAHPDEKGKGN
jgi:hypothetical protein